MKINLIILLIILSACSELKKSGTSISTNQNNSYVKLIKFKGDTLGYVQHNFIDNKQKYVGKDLNTLLKDIEIPIKSYMPGVSMLNDFIVTHLVLQFYTVEDSYSRNFSANNPVDIIITWPKPLSKASVDSLSAKTKGVWTNDARKYFGNKITQDIFTTKWKN